VTGFSPSTSVPPVSIIPLLLPTTTYCSYKNERRDKPGNLPKSSALRISGSNGQKSAFTSRHDFVAVIRRKSGRDLEVYRQSDATSPSSPLSEIKYLSPLPLASLPSNLLLSVIILSDNHRLQLPSAIYSSYSSLLVY
jgi:hypothetical protein